MPKNINLYSQNQRYKRGRVFFSWNVWKETSILKLQMIYVLLILLFIFVCAFPLVIVFFDSFYIKVIEMRLFWKKVTVHLPLELTLAWILTTGISPLTYISSLATPLGFSFITNVWFASSFPVSFLPFSHIVFLYLFNISWA